MIDRTVPIRTHRREAGKSGRTGMELIAEIRRRGRHVIGPAVGLLAISYFAYHALHGDRGLLAWHLLDQRIAEARAELAALEAERHTLEHRVRLLHPDSLDADLLEEWVRRGLGYGRPEDIVIMTTAPAGDGE